VPVTLGHDYGTTVEIVSGIDPNDQVIVAPSDSLSDGTLVRVANPPATAPAADPPPAKVAPRAQTAPQAQK